jgi:UPF0755 protein
MQRILIKLTTALTLIATCTYIATYSSVGLMGKRIFPDDQHVVIPPKTPLRKIAKILKDDGIIKSETSFILSIILTGSLGKIKAGEYLIPKNTTPLNMAEIFGSGKTVNRKFTVIEGTSVAKIVQDLQENNILSGNITDIPPEGFVLPDTYIYVYHDNRQELLNKMVAAMKTFLIKHWSPNMVLTGIKNVNNLLTMASVVEKETGIASERSQIAGVFFNRLKLNMPLQSDPTVIYAMTLGKTKLDRALTRNDLETVDSPYNTYRYRGLPPTPIACPGRDAILAVLKPAQTDALYFVANGTGGHSFAANLIDHNNNVAVWRQIQRQGQIVAPTDGPATTVNEEITAPSTNEVVSLPNYQQQRLKVKRPKKASLKQIGLKTYRKKKK